MNAACATAVSGAAPSPTRTIRNVSALQAPVASHALDPSAAQIVPRGTPGGFDGTPFVQRSDVQLLPSTGTSALSATEVVQPFTSHTAFWQLSEPWGSWVVTASGCIS